MLLPMVLIFAIFWFLIIQPQRKQQKRHREFLGTLKKGDEVVTQSGILGRVFAVDDSEVVLEIADKVKIKMIKGYVSGPRQSPGTSNEAS